MFFMLIDEDEVPIVFNHIDFYMHNLCGKSIKSTVELITGDLKLGHFMYPDLPLMPQEILFPLIPVKPRLNFETNENAMLLGPVCAIMA